MYSYKFWFAKSKQEEYDFSTKEFWTPQLNDWRDIIEDYIYISRKRRDNKFSMFKLQMNILEDIINNSRYIHHYKQRLNELDTEIKERGDPDREKVNQSEFKSVELKIFELKQINRVLKEVADGIAWRYFNFNRAILYILADKEPIEYVTPDEGLISSVYKFADIFWDKEKFAILSDITNFIRVGDLTVINKDGGIEFVEVKSGKKKGARKLNSRVRRQKKHMEELVEAFNTGSGEIDDKKFKILDSKEKQVNHLHTLKELIQKAKMKGYSAELIGNYLIVNVVDLGNKFNSPDKLSKYFESKHKSIRENWKRDNDFYLPFWFSRKLIFSRNYAPFSIYPFDAEICADILMGKLQITAVLNLTEIKRIFEKSGWKVVESVHDWLDKEISDTEPDPNKLFSFKVNKGGFSSVIPPAMTGRIVFEMLSPKSILSQLEKMYNEGPDIDYDTCLINYLDDQKKWS